jgi:hypothetical protein
VSLGAVRKSLLALTFLSYQYRFSSASAPPVGTAIHLDAAGVHDWKIGVVPFTDTQSPWYEPPLVTSIFSSGSFLSFPEPLMSSCVFVSRKTSGLHHPAPGLGRGPAEILQSGLQVVGLRVHGVER